MGLDGNLYYTVTPPNKVVSIGKVDGKTGEVKYLRSPKPGQCRHRPRHHPRREGNFLVRREPGAAASASST